MRTANRRHTHGPAFSGMPPQRGMTLVELVATVAVIAVVVAIGTPPFKDLLSNTHSTVVSNRLLVDMAHARSEAIMNHNPSVVCPSDDGSTCSGKSDWSGGWIVFVDRDDNDQRSNSEPLLSVVSAADLGGLQVRSTADRTRARFLPDGGSGGTNLTLRVCDGAKLTRLVVINISGRTRVERPKSSDQSCQ